MELGEHYRRYREWVVPARVLNRPARVRQVTQEEEDRIDRHLNRIRYRR